MAAADGTVRANEFHQTCRGNGDGKHAKLTSSNTGSPSGDGGRDQLATRERQAGPCGVAERSVVPMKPGNSGGGKGSQLNDESSHPGLCSGVADGVTCFVYEACVFSESRMREICLSGSMSGNRKQSQAKPD